jgi:hypothetical protein
MLVMPRGLHRYYGADHLHFITCSYEIQASAARATFSASLLLNLAASMTKRSCVRREGWATAGQPAILTAYGNYAAVHSSRHSAAIQFVVNSGEGSVGCSTQHSKHRWTFGA